MPSEFNSSITHYKFRNVALVASILCFILLTIGCAGQQTTPVPEYQSPNDNPLLLATQTLPSPSATYTPEPTSTPETTLISGVVAQCSYPNGDLIGIPNVKIQLGDISTMADDKGNFHIEVPSGEKDPILEISADVFLTYTERPSRMVNGAFYLIPESVYKDLYTVVWELQIYNQQNWMRKWTRQPEIIIAREQGTTKQVLTVVSALIDDDVFNKMTGGLYYSNNITILDKLPSALRSPGNRDGKIIIYFAERMMGGDKVDMGGSAYSADHSDGNISYTEIVWNPSDDFNKYNVLHELTHAITECVNRFETTLFGIY